MAQPVKAIRSQGYQTPRTRPQCAPPGNGMDVTARFLRRGTDRDSVKTRMDRSKSRLENEPRSPWPGTRAAWTGEASRPAGGRRPARASREVSLQARSDV